MLVQNSIRETFTQRLVDLARTARKGDPMLPDTNIGPVTTAPQFRKILEYIDIAKAEGARCILGGGPATSADLPGGQFVEPTIFTDVKPEMRIAREEVFGPVLSILGFEDEAEAIRLANDTIYGLAAGVWTSRYRPSDPDVVGAEGGNSVGQHLSGRQLHDAVRRNEELGNWTRERD